jgi:F-type H+-transporting ATPase subunit delta
MAGRYATALYELADESKTVDAVLDDLQRFEALIASSDDLRRLVKSPVFSADEQMRAIDAILAKLETTELTANFLRLVIKNRRLFALDRVIRAFYTLVAQARGELTADVTVAEPLNEARAKDIKDALREVTAKDVKVRVKVDPSIIGGIIVQLGSRMVDASLRTKLSAIQHAMKEVR